MSSAARVSASDLLDAITDLLHANRINVHSNIGGSWFYDPAGMGTYPLIREDANGKRTEVIFL